MPATINPATGDPCERVFAALARPHCEMCDDTGTITIEDDDGHDTYRSEQVPCPACEAGDEAAWWAAVDEAVQWHRDEAEMLVPVPAGTWDDDVPY